MQLSIKVSINLKSTQGRKEELVQPNKSELHCIDGALSYSAAWPPLFSQSELSLPINLGFASQLWLDNLGKR